MEKFSVALATIVFILSSCGDSNTAKKSSETAPTKFVSLDAETTGISFRNDIVEREGANYILNDNMYQGAGVGVGDINNDGLPDIYFCGNQAPDKLYLNEGNFKFKDITASAGIINDFAWSMGVNMIDINNDGLVDITVSNHYHQEPEKRKNKVYINQGNLKFVEQAEALGLADPGYSIQTTYFDMDKDGDLDAFVANQPPTWRLLKRRPENASDPMYSDHLYRNDNGKFVKVTEQFGVRNFQYSLNVNATDLDRNGWVDLYVTADYEGADAYYHNNSGTSFTNVVDESMRHLSNFSMGSDVADINNDGLMDLFVADMVAEDNYRNKTNMSGMNPEKFWALANAGFHHQYMFNTLQVNNGNGRFSEVAQLSEVAMTDWSWSPLMADFDNDGWRDIIVTNGLFRDVRNKDYHKERNKKTQVVDGKNFVNANTQLMPLIEMAPSVRISNYAYKNHGDFDFRRIDEEWGVNFEGWSQGSAYADLDNDGDLDLVVNNMNDPALIYRNETHSNYLRIVPSSNSKKTVANTRADVFYQGQMQTAELATVRGYMSCSENVIHFGLGDVETVDSLVVTWPNGKRTVMTDVKGGTSLDLAMEEANAGPANDNPAVLASKDSSPILDHQHTENDYDDYATEILLPHRMSTLGPHLSKGDMNADGIDDIYIGGAAGSSGSLWLSSGAGYQQQSGPWSKYSASEELGSCMFDADGDADLDLYVAAGGNEAGKDSPLNQDRLYINNGGSFSEAKLPSLVGSNSCVKAADVDGDGDQDLFVGGRQQPGKYPYHATSVLLKNDGGTFSDATSEWAPMLENIGMVTDAVFTDRDGDGDQDLILVGEWMAIRVLNNDGGTFSDQTESLGLANSTGWWNTVEAADMDGDGDLDLVAGNLGLNIKYKASEEQPFRVMSTDFDDNGTNDIVLSYYQQGKCFPVRGRQCSSQQMPMIKDKFPTYHDFAVATVDQIYGDKMDEALVLEAKTFSSVYLENTGSGYVLHELPVEAQFSAVQGIVIDDVDGDSNMDIIVAGNYYHREVETTRSDASIGYIFLGNGKGEFETVHPTVAGLELYQDVRDIAMVNHNGTKKLVAAINGGPMQSYTINSSAIQ